MSSGTKQTSTTKSSGGSSTTNTTTTNPYQEKYYNQLLGQAHNLYKQGLPEYYQGATVAGMTPDQLQSMQMTRDYVTGGMNPNMNATNAAFQQMLSGRVDTGPGSPYGDMMGVFQRQAMDSANDMMGQLRQNQVMSGQYGGSSRGDLMNNRVIEEANQQVTDAGAQMYANAYNTAQQQQANALGQYGSIMNMPMEMYKNLYNRVGLPQQQLNQAIMNDAKARYDYAAMAPWQNLAQFANFISGNMGGSTTASSNSSYGGTSTTTVS